MPCIAIACLGRAIHAPYLLFALFLMTWWFKTFGSLMRRILPNRPLFETQCVLLTFAITAHGPVQSLPLYL
jgi:hypothetical protein